MARLGGVLAVIGVQLAAAAPAQPIGTAAPQTSAELPGHGRWYVVCEARKDTDGDGTIHASFDGAIARGDAYESYLILGSGPGIPIDHVAAASGDGGWLAVVRGNALELHDTVRHTTTKLPADLTYDAGRQLRREPRFVSMGSTGTYLTYLTRDAIVIRELATATERTVKVTGTLWRADIEAGERWAQVKVIRKDTNRDGKLGWRTTNGRAMYGCPSSTRRVEAKPKTPETSDEAVTLWLDLTTATIVDDPTVIGTAGAELLRRRPDGTLLLGTTVVAPATCNARVAATLASPPRAAITCGSKQDAIRQRDRPVVLVGAGGFRKETGFEEAHGEADGFTWDTHAGSRFRHDRERALDLATGDVLALPRFAGRKDDLVALHTPKGVAVFDLVTRKSTLLVGSPVFTGERDVWFEGGLVEIEGTIWDAITGAKLARPGLTIHRRMDDGRYLVSEKDRGPLQLVR